MKISKILMMFAAILIGIANIYAQEDFTMAQKAPQLREVVLNNNAITRKGCINVQSAYKAALREACEAYSDKDIAIRNLKKGNVKINSDGSVSNYYTYTIVEKPGLVAQRLYDAIGKATSEISEGSRFALDKLSVTDESLDKEKIRGQIVDCLLRKGHKVVAKEYLQKLYKEQIGQQSGIFNTDTTVKENNFSAVGFLITTRITNGYLQVQIINVSTGEYENNIIINF